MAFQSNQDEQYWTNKWLREGFTMPFGSLMNAYGQIKAGTPFNIDEFAQDSFKICALSRKMINDSVGEQSEKMDSEQIIKVKEFLKKLENK